MFNVASFCLKQFVLLLD